MSLPPVQEGNAVAALGSPRLGSPPDPVLCQPPLPSPPSLVCAQQGWSPAHTSNVDGFSFSWRLRGSGFVFGLVRNFKEGEVTLLTSVHPPSPLCTHFR